MQKLIYHQMKLKQILILTSTVIQLLFKTRKEAITMHYTFWLRDFAKYSKIVVMNFTVDLMM